MIHKKKCKICGTEFETTSTIKICCSPECSKQNHRQFRKKRKCRICNKKCYGIICKDCRKKGKGNTLAKRKGTRRYNGKHKS